MGLRGIGPGSLLLIALIVVLLFGTKRLRSVGTDLGSALKGFRKGLEEGGVVDEAPTTASRDDRA